MSIERIDDQTPTEILQLVLFPYSHFTKLLPEVKVKKMTLLDIGCGNQTLHSMYLENFKKVIYMDLEPQNDEVLPGSITDIPLKDNSVDITYCFETIEHINYEDQLQAMSELIRVTKKALVVGSVDELGLDFIHGVEIYKAKNNKNPYHLGELSATTFKRLMEDSLEYLTDSGMLYGFQSTFDEMLRLDMIESKIESSENIFCNYAVIQKDYSETGKKEQLW